MQVHTKQDAYLLADIALRTGTLILENGGEIYRVEETSRRLLETVPNIKKVNIFATYNVIMISFGYNKETLFVMNRTFVKRFDLRIINRVNLFARNFAKGEYKLTSSIEAIETMERYHALLFKRVLGIGIGSACFSYLIIGGVKESLLALFISMAALGVHNYLIRRKQIFFMNIFLTTTFSTFVTCLFLMGFKLFGWRLNVDGIIVGNIMGYLPGVAITNSVRDIMGGDMISGVSAMVNAVFVAMAIALGVGFILMIFKGVL